MSDQVPPSSHRLRRMASDYEKAVSEARAEQIAARAVSRAHPVSPARRPMAAVLIGAAMVMLLTGLGVASANSLPGDSLYGVSRAYEEVGARVGLVDPVERRLTEVIALAERGDTGLAAQAAEEALVELGYDSGSQPSLAPTTTTTEPGQSDGTPSNGTTPTTAPPTVTVEATPEEVAEDQVNSLKLAAAALLSNVQDNGGDLEAAAAELAQAVSDVAIEEPPGDEETTTTTTVPPSTSTSTTIPDSTTTVPDSTTTVPDSTTTTAPEEEEEAGKGKGPIFLPPSP